jgi:hypothetical protein
MPAVGPDRFDDVEFRMLEQPEPPGRPRLRRWTLTALSAVLATGMFAAGASALTSEDRAPAPNKAEGWHSYGPMIGKKGRDCERGKHRGADRNLELKH